MSARVADRPASCRTRSRSSASSTRLASWYSKHGRRPSTCCSGIAPRGCTVRIVQIDVRPGGRFHFCIHNPSFGDCWCVGVYREVVRPERIVYSLATADSAGNDHRSCACRPRSEVAARDARDRHLRGRPRLHAADAGTERARIAREAHRCPSELAADAGSPGCADVDPEGSAMRSSFVAIAALALASASGGRAKSWRVCRSQRHQDVLRDARSGAGRSAGAVARGRLDDRYDLRPDPALPGPRSSCHCRRRAGAWP